MWCAHQAGVNVPDCVSTRDGATHFKAQRQWYTTPAIGDFVFFDFIEDNKTVIQHIGLVIRVTEKSIVAVEGNTSGTGSQANGGQVMLKTRALGAHSFVVGYGRPVYKTPQPLKETN